MSRLQYASVAERNEAMSKYLRYAGIAASAVLIDPEGGAARLTVQGPRRLRRCRPHRRQQGEARRPGSPAVFGKRSDGTDLPQPNVRGTGEQPLRSGVADSEPLLISLAAGEPDL